MVGTSILAAGGISSIMGVMNNTRKIIIIHRLSPNRRGNRKNGTGFFVILARLTTVAIFAILAAVTLVVASSVGAVAAVYAYYAKDLPDPRAIETQQEHRETTKIYDRTGQHLLYEVFDPRFGDRTYIPVDQIPLYLRQATITIEDRTFYENPGISPEGIARAFVQNLTGGSVQGGSSITQQLIKNVLIEPEERTQRSYARKIKEIILALEISRRYSKSQILEWYLNTNFYGNLAYGVEAASQVYFGKHVQELNLAEAAMLAAIPQFPGLNPIDNPEQARKRQEVVLEKMVEQGYITQEQATAARDEKLKIQPVQERFDIIAPHFSIYVRKLLEEEFGPEMVHRGGLRVYTTLDLDLQQTAERIVREQIKKLEEAGKKAHDGTLVAIRPRTGEVLAMVGSVDYWNKEIDGNVNMALAERQPGSSFKPFNYVTAFAQGYTAATMVMDVRRSFPNPPEPPYVPEDYDRKYHGPVRLRTALACSYNIPAVWVLQQAGVKNVVNTAHRMGIETLNADYYGLSLTLGGGEVRPIDMAFAYGVFANNGTMAGEPVPANKRRPGYRELQPVTILRVEDKEGNVLKEYTRPETRQVLSPQLAYLITSILSDNDARTPAFGSRSPLLLSRPAAAKTGTTNDWRDNWTIGFTPQLVTAVWVGNANNEPMENVSGLSGAAPIWHDFMEYALRNEPVEKFVRPPGLVDVEIDPVAGLLPTQYSEPPLREIFIEGTQPTAYDNVHRAFRINKETGKLATVYTPPELVEERIYKIFPPEAADWVRANNIPQPPTEYDDQYGPGPAVGDVAIISPNPYAYIHGGVVISGNAKGDNFQLYRLEYGQGLNPGAWTQIGGDHNAPGNNGPLETWDVSSLEGLYTLQLTVVRNDQSFQRSAIQVTVDNTPPSVTLVNPTDGKIYIKEDDEWVNIQADASDNVSMDRVEFYMDNSLLGTTTVAPYSLRWTIVMSDRIPVPGQSVVETQVISNPDGTVTTIPITLTQTITDTTGRITQVFSGGMTVITDTGGYTETHLIHVIAYDAAGNKTESGKVRIEVSHKPKEEDKEKKKPSAALLPDRSQRLVALPQPVAYLPRESGPSPGLQRGPSRCHLPVPVKGPFQASV
jgi:1A family penicillin-binding protein